MEEMARRALGFASSMCSACKVATQCTIRECFPSFEEGEGTLGIAGNDCLNDIAGIAIGKLWFASSVWIKIYRLSCRIVQLLGIEVCGVIEETERAALIIKPDISAKKLKLVFAEKSVIVNMLVC